MGSNKFNKWQRDKDIPAEKKQVFHLMKVDISLVYPEDYTKSLNFPVTIPRGKIDRLRRKYKWKLVDKICTDAARMRQILQKNQPFYLEPVQYVIDPPGKIYSPFLQDFIKGSDYLRGVFEHNYFAYWFASLVTNYRHNHIKSYDAAWRNKKYAEDNETYQKARSHQDFRIMTNNRAKRQIMRAIMRDRNITRFGAVKLIRAVINLQHNDDETLELANRCLAKFGVPGLEETFDLQKPGQSDRRA